MQQYNEPESKYNYLSGNNNALFGEFSERIRTLQIQQFQFGCSFPNEGSDTMAFT